MKQPRSDTDDMITDMLMADTKLKCFHAVVPSIGHIQKAALFSPEGRSYQNKYPAAAGHAIRSIAEEVLARVQAPS